MLPNLYAAKALMRMPCAFSFRRITSDRKMKAKHADKKRGRVAPFFNSV